MLSAEQVGFYRENGYIVIPELFSAAQMQGLRDACDEISERARSIKESDADYELDPLHRPDDIRIRRLFRPIASDRRFAEISRHPKVIDALAQLIGPGVRISHPSGKLIMKPAHHGAPIEWHQDWAGYPHTNDDLLSIGVPLDDVGPENGPMLVIPGSHKGEVYSHHTEAGEYVGGIDPVRSGIDFSKAVPLTGKAGMMMIHHARTLHGSAANNSPRPRRLFIVQYAAVDAWPLFGVKDFDAFNAAIVRGEPTLRPRLEKVPVLLPTGSGTFRRVYEAQSNMEHHFFAAPR